MLDSIRTSFTHDPLFLIKLDARNSFISSYLVKLKGVKVGLNFNNTTNLGIGYSWLSTDFHSIYNSDTVKLKMHNFSTFIEYTFYRTERVYADIPVHLGVSRLTYNNDDRTLATAYALVYEPAMTIEYRILRFFGLGMGAGYRLVLYNHKQINEKLSSPIYIFRFKVYFGDIYKKHFTNQ